jgi:hypothetical protein
MIDAMLTCVRAVEGAFSPARIDRDSAEGGEGNDGSECAHAVNVSTSDSESELR